MILNGTELKQPHPTESDIEDYPRSYAPLGVEGNKKKSEFFLPISSAGSLTIFMMTQPNQTHIHNAN